MNSEIRKEMVELDNQYRQLSDTIQLLNSLGGREIDNGKLYKMTNAVKVAKTSVSVRANELQRQIEENTIND